MRKILIIVLLFVSIGTFGQGFFGPVNRDMFKGTDKSLAGEWLVRPVVQVTAMQFILKSPVEVVSFSQIGTGVSYAHFVERNGEPYQDFSVNGLVLFGQDLAGVAPANISLAATVSVFQYLNVGAGFDFGVKKMFILTGVAFNFNR